MRLPDIPGEVEREKGKRAPSRRMFNDQGGIYENFQYPRAYRDNINS